ncbi:MAG: hypothetical protein PWR20_443 [Bacteroidales bacterium]|jgi:hypothetical protein|nr:hypothetical protein [Bacteroidales bacterium]MDN5329013.1 hypothetical protein [Bacteroidales bacterium]
MNINFEEIIEGLTQAMQGYLSAGVDEAKTYAARFTERRQMRLTEIARFYADNIITADQMREELEDEGRLLEAQLIAIHAIAKAAAQKAANAAINFLTGYFIQRVKPF